MLIGLLRPVDLGAAIGDRTTSERLWVQDLVNGMKRIVTAAAVAILAGALLPDGGAQAQTATSGARTAQAADITDASAQRRRPLRQDQWEPDVYPRYNPGPNAVRSCTATYVQEYRPSGTVITPRMNCYWVPG